MSENGNGHEPNEEYTHADYIEDSIYEVVDEVMGLLHQAEDRAYSALGRGISSNVSEDQISRLCQLAKLLEGTAELCDTIQEES